MMLILDSRSGTTRFSQLVSSQLCIESHSCFTQTKILWAGFLYLIIIKLTDIAPYLSLIDNLMTLYPALPPKIKMTHTHMDTQK